MTLFSETATIAEINIFGLAHEFPRLFAEARLAWSENADNIPNHKEHRNVDDYHQYVVKVEAECGLYYVRFTIREGNGGADRNEMHGTTISNVCAYKASGAELSLLRRTQGEDSAPFDDNKLSLFFAPVNGLPQKSDLSPEDIFDYIYGVLHSPAYRAKFK